MRCYALILLLVAASPIASDWRMFGVTRDAIGLTVNFVDLASVTAQGDIRTVRVAQVDGDKSSPAEERRLSVDLDCSTGKIRLMPLAVTYWSGTTENFAAQHRPWMKPSPWQEAAPGSWGRALQALICKGEARDKARPITGTPLQAGREVLKNNR
ncbi:hypothetical protein QH494_28225 [Sphingomonas sp. AR_OL41]|uniref:hypothetical protein n=1 Tax=Sphingomonas sp. AR_OL41 TaxID=3042729 RepID=UPI0024812AD2|nr:hypothetical protein [Sphingomonas sp. AR_OL41]MDH7976083.1 hypothetical protein [Sphingomonas sp. AR_OL41]